MSSSFEISTKEKIEVLDVTPLVEGIVKETRDANAENAKACLVFTEHTTAAIRVNEFEPNLKSDLERFYSKLAREKWNHNKIDNNAEAHIMASAIGPSVTIPLQKRRLSLGTWQRVLFIELDGPRKRKINVTLL